jgi:hypothetical protein
MTDPPPPAPAPAPAPARMVVTTTAPWHRRCHIHGAPTPGEENR